MKINYQEEGTPKPIFYVFSGIDKTLSNNTFKKTYYGDRAPIHDDYDLDPDCVHALNFLLSNLEEKYDTRLVITSNRRANQHNCINYLKNNGLNYDKPIAFTKMIHGTRGEKVVEFLESNGATPLTYHTAPLYVRLLKRFKDNPDFNNYVVLDGSGKSYSRYIPKSQIKKISPKTGLTKDMAFDILVENGIKLIQFDMGN